MMIGITDGTLSPLVPLAYRPFRKGLLAQYQGGTLLPIEFRAEAGRVGRRLFE
jgi:hypothetical protein